MHLTNVHMLEEVSNLSAPLLHKDEGTAAQWAVRNIL